MKFDRLIITGICGTPPTGLDQSTGGGSICEQSGGGVLQYTVSQQYEFGSTRVYVDGTFQRLNLDYTENDPTAGTIIFGTAPAPPATVTICFIPSVG